MSSQNALKSCLDVKQRRLVYLLKYHVTRDLKRAWVKNKKIASFDQD
jgi:hypothetical protein